MNINELIVPSAEFINKVSEISFSDKIFNITNFEYYNYMCTYPGEHYKLIGYLSSIQQEPTVFMDLGTHYGHSALAMSINPKVKIKSYDIVDLKQLKKAEELKNIEFIIGDGTEDPDLLKSSVILLDTTYNNNCEFENKLINKLLGNKYKGIVLVDDIHHSQDTTITTWWFTNWLREKDGLRTYDISWCGHHSGTGLIVFE